MRNYPQQMLMFFDSGIKATPHNSRCTACLNLIPSACPKNLGKAARRQPYLNLFVQPDEKSYCAIRTPELCGIALIILQKWSCSSLHILLKTRANNAVPAFTLKRRSVVVSENTPDGKAVVLVQYLFVKVEQKRKVSWSSEPMVL